MLQDLLLQIFAGLQLASELDTAVCSLRRQGTWPNLLQSLQLPMPVNPPDTHTMEPAVEAPHNNESCRSLAQHSTLYICPLLVCTSMRVCSVGAPNAVHVAAAGFAAAKPRIRPFIFTVPRTAGWCANEPAISRRHADRVYEPRTGTSAPFAAYGYAHFTRYVSMSLEDFVQKMIALIAQGCFAELGIPQARVAGATACGVWLRINSRHATFTRRPRLLCGAFFHIAKRTVTFHGNASQATRLLPAF